MPLNKVWALKWKTRNNADTKCRMVTSGRHQEIGEAVEDMNYCLETLYDTMWDDKVKWKRRIEKANPKLMTQRLQ